MEKTLLDRFLELKLVNIVIQKSKIIVLPGFDGMPLFDVMIFFLRSIGKGALTQRASAIAFNFFLALFPAILFFFTLIPYFPVSDFHSNMMDFIKDALPSSIFEFVFETLNDIVNRPHSGLLSVGFIMALYFSTRGFKSIISSFHQSYILEDKRLSFWKLQWNSLTMVFFFTIVTILTILLTTFSNFIVDYLVLQNVINSDWTYYLLLSVNFIVYTAMIFFIISFIYYLGSPKNEKFRFISAGSTFATLLYGLSFFGFDYYITNFSTYNVLYGSIGTIIILLIWIYFNALIILVGYELNLSISQANHKVTK